MYTNVDDVKAELFRNERLAIRDFEIIVIFYINKFFMHRVVICSCIYLLIQKCKMLRRISFFEREIHVISLFIFRFRYYLLSNRDLISIAYCAVSRQSLILL